MKEMIRKAYINKKTKQLSIIVPKRMLPKGIQKQKDIHFRIKPVSIK